MKNHKILKPIMFVGTCSDAGKSVINAAFCRIFKQDGYSPAPFKAQNMSLNSFSTPEGGEMGRAQVVQAEACGIAPHTDMNPVLLKPTSDKGSQVILNGRPIGNMSAHDYFGMKLQKEDLFKEAQAAFDRLKSQYNPIVLEGAGSISEINLRDRDITNMRMAIYAQADTYLVADIDRGGVFGSVYGTIALLKPEERKLVKGIIINKFRGDISLFEEGRKIIEELTGIPVVGIIPYFRNIKIEEEDSVALEMKTNTYQDGKINVAIILLKRMSNFTDFDVLEMDSRFNAYYTNNVEEIEKADIILLPGTKNTLADLQSIRANHCQSLQKREKGDWHLRRISNDGCTPGRSGRNGRKLKGCPGIGFITSNHHDRTREGNQAKPFCLLARDERETTGLVVQRIRNPHGKNRNDGRCSTTTCCIVGRRSPGWVLSERPLLGKLPAWYLRQSGSIRQSGSRF